jgi:ABC-type uncharacterized transport system permease subunit
VFQLELQTDRNENSSENSLNRSFLFFYFLLFKLKTIMSKNIAIRIKQWVQIWKSAAAKINILRQKKLSELNKTIALNNLTRAFDLTMKNTQIKNFSRVVEQQAYFKKLLKQ